MDSGDPQPNGPGWSAGYRLRMFGDEVERLVVVAVAVVKSASQVVVERVDVGRVEAAGVLDLVAAGEGHLAHEAEDAAARGARELRGATLKDGSELELC